MRPCWWIGCTCASTAAPSRPSRWARQQVAVELGVTKIDYPDPLYAGDVLTYLLTVSNSSTINAPGVVVTDTLPADVQLAIG